MTFVYFYTSDTSKHLFKCLINEAMYTCAIAFFGQQVPLTRRTDAVGEEDVDEVVLRIDPETGASEASVSPGARTAFWCHVRVLVALGGLTVEAQTSARTCGTLRGELVADGFVDILVPLLSAIVGQHQQDTGQRGGRAEQAGVALYAHGPSADLVMDGAMNELVAYGLVDLGRCYLAELNALVERIEAELSAEEGAKTLLQILVELLARETLHDVAQKNEIEAGIEVLTLFLFGFQTSDDADHLLVAELERWLVVILIKRIAIAKT